MNRQSFIKARADYIELIKSELLGPGSEINIPDKEHELISDAPIHRYSVGILFPKDSSMNIHDSTVDDVSTEETEQEDDSDKSDDYVVESHMAEETEQVSKSSSSTFLDDNLDEKDNANEEVNLASQNKPSSFGICFIIEAKSELTEIQCRFDFATYRKANINDCRFPMNMKMLDNLYLNSEISSYMYFDKAESALKLHSQIDRKRIRDLLEHIRSNVSEDEYRICEKIYKLEAQLSKGYVREPHSQDVTIRFFCSDYVQQELEIDDFVKSESNNRRKIQLKVSALKRKIGNNKYSVTVMVLNDSDCKDKKSMSLYSVFQPVLSIDSRNNNFTFGSYTNITDFSRLSEEEQSTELQYRMKKSYGTGLGVSLDWNSIDENGNGILKSEYFPQYEVPSVDFKFPKKYCVDEKALSMKYLSDLDDSSKAEKIGLLTQIVDAYETWINELKSKQTDLNVKYSDIAQKNIDGCTLACKRMKKGLRILKSSDNAWIAFTLANRAMYMQRVHLKIQSIPESPYYSDNEEIKKILDTMDYLNPDKRINDKFSWRPFQIGFLLMSIDGIVNDKSEDRELIDLIWFPTGGGKTEAYLGLTAFTIFFRRLQYPKESDGTTVIMRYTLRLLTAQQFTRASTLICACEYIRQGRDKRYPNYNLGEKEISIGLWIGSSHTPNDNKDADYHLKNLKSGSGFGPSSLRNRLDYHNKFQVLKCPWCGTSMIKSQQGKREIGDWGYAMPKKHFELRCKNENCFFNDVTGKLPIQIVDEELYRTPPTLLFATVDKFAMMAWREETGSFFAQKSKNRTPELIIQDELHLISGPLGTIVGLYETAIDYLCRQKECTTKIIASTATIKKAKEQCSALYNRKVSQFPHPGLDYNDSFFSRENSIDYKNGIYGRKYVGIFPSGETKIAAETKIIAALMQQLSTMELPDEEKDKLWSLVLYFNSLRDLGMCSSLLRDAVRDSIKSIGHRTDSKLRPVRRFDELTSRVSTSNLNATMDILEKIKYTSDKEKEKIAPIDAVLATNMISVGIDISRLNVMLVIGQPKLTSEYIQASSRIGREYPGVAFVLYDAARSRDRSHYEQFKSYHQTFYKYVEPTVATPFSKPARDRALHAVIVSMFRHKFRELSSDESAVNFKIDDYKDAIEEIKKFILDRQKQINAVMNPDAEDESKVIAKEIDDFLEKWQESAENYKEGKFYYGKRFMVSKPDEEKQEGRLLKPFSTANYDNAVDTMTSMRSVDVSVAGKLLIWEDET